MHSDSLWSGPIVLDASAIFNLLGCKKPIDVLQALGVLCIIEERTMAEIIRHPIPGLCHKEVISSLVEKKHVEIYRMSADEYELYLSLVSGKPTECLDDGESAAIAVAVTQKKTVILDDGKARRVFGARFSSASLASSLKLFLAAAERAGWNAGQIHELIQAARLNARMSIMKEEQSLFKNTQL
jgi:predicted nucleic acid-binding protein